MQSNAVWLGQGGYSVPPPYSPGYAVGSALGVNAASHALDFGIQGVGKWARDQYYVRRHRRCA